MDSARIDNLEARFDRVEDKLDDIGTSLRLLASIDERTGHVLERLSQGARTFADHEKRIQSLEQKMYLLMAVAAVVGAVGKMLLEKVF